MHANADCRYIYEWRLPTQLHSYLAVTHSPIISISLFLTHTQRERECYLVCNSKLLLMWSALLTLLISTRQKINLKLSSLAPFVLVSKCSLFAFTILSECTRMLRFFLKITKRSCGGPPQTPLQGFVMQTFSPPSNKFHQPPGTADWPCHPPRLIGM